MGTKVIANGNETLAEAIAALTAGNRDPLAMRQASQVLDRMREELRQPIGTVEVSFELIRETRK